MSHTVSKVGIGNMALSHVGGDSSIEAFGEDSVEANQIVLWYDYSRTQTLEAFNWSFARKRQTLATHSEDPPSGVWAYRYQYPSDAITIREIANPAGKQADAVPFEIEIDATGSTKTILTNLDSAVAVYTFDLETTTLFSSHFVETLSRLLASRIAPTLTSKKEIAERNFAVWQKMIKDAPAQNANEQVGEPPRDADWIRLRD